MAKKKKDSSILQKYWFLEDFPESRDPKTGKILKGIDSPKKVKTSLFGELELHRIARIKWKETKVKQQYYDAEGKIIEKEVFAYEPSLGELGGWVENDWNLSQDGECWIKNGGVVVGDAVVSDDAIIENEVEIGENATIKGKARIQGAIGITGFASVFGNAEVTGGRVDGVKLVVVGENASVKGKVKGRSTVMGEAEVGPDGVVDAESEVYESAYVNGKIKKSKIFGRARVSGDVNESNLSGNVEVLEGGKVIKCELQSGIIGGTIDKSTVALEGTIFSIGKGSVIKECSFSGGIITICKDTKMDNCSVSGVLNITRTTASHCNIYGCNRVSDSKLYYTNVSSSILDQANLTGRPRDYSTVNVSNSHVNSGLFTDTVSISNGITPKGAKWEYVHMSGVTNATIVSGYRVDTNDTKDIVLEGVSFTNRSKLELYKKPKVRIYDRPVYEQRYDSKGRFYTEVIARTEKTEFGKDESNYGRQYFLGITYYNEKTEEYRLKEYIKQEKKDVEERRQKYQKWKKRQQQVYQIEDYFEGKGGGLWDIAHDAAMANIRCTDINYDLEDLWSLKIGTAKACLSGGTSVTPQYCYKARFYHNPSDGDNTENDFRGDNTSDKTILDFTNPVSFESISKMEILFSTTWIVDSFDEYRITGKGVLYYPIYSFTFFWNDLYGYEESYATWLFTEKGTGNVMSFNDMVRYTECIKEGKPTYPSYEELKRKEERKEKWDEEQAQLPYILKV